MKKRISEFVSFGIALVLVGLILWPAIREEKKNSAYDIVFLGDSIVGNVMGEKGIADILEERLGKTVYNGALGGTCMASDNRRGWESVNVPHWSMVKLAQAMYTNDWTAQLAAVTDAEKNRVYSLTVPEYFYERIQELAQIDFSEVEILLIEHGTNDYNSGLRLDSPEDPMDPDTFGGALRRSLTRIREKYPELRIVLISPTYCEIQRETLLKCYEADFGGGTLDDFVKLEKEIAEEFGVEWLDMYYGSGIWENNIDTYLYDKLHPTQEGVMLLGNRIADYLENE